MHNGPQQPAKATHATPVIDTTTITTDKRAKAKARPLDTPFGRLMETAKVTPKEGEPYPQLAKRVAKRLNDSEVVSDDDFITLSSVDQEWAKKLCQSALAKGELPKIPGCEAIAAAAAAPTKGTTTETADTGAETELNAVEPNAEPAPPTDTTEPAQATEATTGPTGTEVIKFEDAVREGEKVFAKFEGGVREANVRLGEIAAKCETKYRENTLNELGKKLEAAIADKSWAGVFSHNEKVKADDGLADCALGRMLKRNRSVYLAWDGDGKKAPAPVSWAVLRELQGHPDRLALVTANPNMTKVAARELMKKYRDSLEGPDDKDDEAEKAGGAGDADVGDEVSNGGGDGDGGEDQGHDDQDEVEDNEDNDAEGDDEGDDAEDDDAEGDDAEDDAAAPWRKHNRRWLRQVLLVANKADAVLKIIAGLAKEIDDLTLVIEADEPLPPEQRAMIREAIAGMEKFLPTLEQSSVNLTAAGTKQIAAGGKLRNLITWFNALADEDDEAEASAAEAPALADTQTDDEDLAAERKAFYAAEEAKDVAADATVGAA